MNLANARLVNTTILDGDIRFANLDHADLTRADLTRSNISNGRFDHADLTQATLQNVIFTDTNPDPRSPTEPRRAIPDRSTHYSTPTSFRHANLTNADLTTNMPTSRNNQPLGAIDVDFSHAIMAGTNLAGTNLAGTNLNLTRLHAVNITQLAPGANLTGTTHTPYQPVTAGGLHSCALNTIGNVHCWGDNTHGQLGNNTTTHSRTPVKVIYPTPAQEQHWPWALYKTLNYDPDLAIDWEARLPHLDGITTEPQ